MIKIRKTLMWPVIVMAAFVGNCGAASSPVGPDARTDFNINILPPTCTQTISEQNVDLGFLTAGDVKEYPEIKFDLQCDVPVKTELSALVEKGELGSGNSAVFLVDSTGQASGLSLQLLNTWDANRPIDLNGGRTFCIRKTPDFGTCSLIPKVTVLNTNITGTVSGVVSFSVIYK